MGNVIKMIALSLPPEGTIGLLPLVAALSATLAGVIGVFFYGLGRVKKSEGLAPGRGEQLYEGPALTWSHSYEPLHKLVTHDTLGLGSDLDWLKNRGEIPASLAPLPSSPQPILALEFAAKVHSTNLSCAADNGARRRKFSAETSAAEKLAALKNPVPAPHPRPTPPSSVRLRTAVLRAADPLPGGAGAVRSVTDAAMATKHAQVPPREPGPAAAAPQVAAQHAAPAPATSKMAAPCAPAVTTHIAPLAAALAATKPAQAAGPVIEGRVTEYSFADFFPATPKPTISPSTNAPGK